MKIDRGSTRAAARVPGVRPRALALTGAFAVALAALAPRATAQSAGSGFLFAPPSGSFTLRAGYAHAAAGSDVFSFTTNQLTVNRGDFSGFTVAGDFGFRVASRVDLVLGSSYAGTNTRSEFRNFVDQNDLPIEQTTTFQRVPVTASVKLYLAPRGRSVGHFAWIPARLTPWVGGGGGAEWYRFRQRGDFVDFGTNAVFPDVFSSSGWTPEAHAMAGVDLSLSPRFAVTGEGRYTWARANMSQDFAGFDKIDLSGFAVTAGIAVRF